MLLAAAAKLQTALLRKNQLRNQFSADQGLDTITRLCYKMTMKLAQLKEFRVQRRQTQEEASRRLGVSQEYLSMLESGRRRPSPKLAQKLMRMYHLPATVLPVQVSTACADVTDEHLARELASLGYPRYAHLPKTKKLNPAEFLLLALSQRNLEARTAEGLPWVVLRYPDMDFDWLVPQARMKLLQNRLGFTVTLAREVSRNDALRGPERALDESKLAKEDSFCRELSGPERRWLQEHSSDEARHWNLLSDLRADVLRYAAA